MKHRRIGLWLGFIVLFVFCFAPRSGFSSEIYKVKKGNTLSGIAKRYHVSVQALKDANRLQSNALSLNQTLIIPIPEQKNTSKSYRVSAPKAAKCPTYIVKKGDTLIKIAKVTGVSVSDLKAINQVKSTSLRPGQKLGLTHSHPTGPGQKNTEALDNFNLDDLEEIEDVPETSDNTLDQTNEEPAPRFLGKWSDSKERDLLVRISKGFLGAPYRFGGVSLRGIDCSAFVKRIYSIFDIDLPRTAREQAKVGQSIPRDNLIIGDLVFFHTRRYNTYSHVGIYIGNDEFVHAAAGRSRQVRISSLNEPYYNKHFVKAVRVKALEDKL
ncbi:MAG: C40 family peptidase [Syntrophaceae bacterium]|nr:C40 family peptidase [Syntrophaceae bacterium]